MPKKRRLIKSKHPNLSDGRPNFWTCKDAESTLLVEALALRMKANAPFALFFAEKPIDSRPMSERWAKLALALAGELFEEFEKPKQKKMLGRRPRQIDSIFNPLLNPWGAARDAASDARLVQLFNAIKVKRQRRGESHRVRDICAELVRRYSGRYPGWAYNNLKTAASLERRGWQKVSREIKAHPDRHVPSDGSELFYPDGRPRLPPVPQ
jgi:hypothetical protein